MKIQIPGINLASSGCPVGLLQLVIEMQQTSLHSSSSVPRVELMTCKLAITSQPAVDTTGMLIPFFTKGFGLGRTKMFREMLQATLHILKAALSEEFGVY